MCGIAGVYSLKEELFAKSDLVKMANAIEHRGPDGEGFYQKASVSLAHKRLSILDVSEKGAQPMKSGRGDWVIAFNGCIYNYKELKHELIAKGHVFKSTSDTEVIVEGLEAEGVSFFERLNGMFAIAAYQVSVNRLFLSRDRFGVKPLYYWFDGQKIVFGSEIKAILAHPDYQVKLDHDALNEYFTFQNLFSYNSLFKDITQLPPANTVEINSEIKFLKHQSWWDYDFSEPDETMTFEDAKQETERLFEQAVKRQMISDVPVGSYLSGGMDSGSIASIASNANDELTTFTCGFDMSSVTGFEANYDERRAAELMASIFGTEHYEQVIGAGAMVKILNKVVYHLEEPRVGMSYPNYYIARLASKFVKVCLQGTGGDELYGGYPWRYYRIFDSVGRTSYFNQYFDFWQRLVLEEEKQQLFIPKISKQIDLSRPRKVFERVFLFNDKLKYDSPEDHIQNSLYFEIKTFLPGLLMVGDKLAMANGLEERFPFLDNDLVEFAQKIPIRHKLGNLENEIKTLDENIPNKKKVYREFDDGKNVLRKAMINFMPEEILKRKKQGFSAPDENWYRKENAKFIREKLLDKNAFIQEIIDQKYVQRILNEHNSGKTNHRLLIWSFLNMESWGNQFQPIVS